MADAAAPDAGVMHSIEAGLVRAVMALLRMLGPAGASNFAGWLFRMIGPMMPSTQVADTNLRMVYPDASPAERKRIIRGAWDSLGRTIGEMPHVGRLQRTASGPGWDVSGEQTLIDQVFQGGPALFVSAHIGNWEMLPPIATYFGVNFASVYRAANNPRVDALIMGLREDAVRQATGKPISIPMFGKGSTGARGMLKHLLAGGYLGMLTDQKMNDGIEALFFGYPAMTASAPASLALRLRCPIIPGRVERIGPARLRLVVDPPLPLPDTGDRDRDVAELTQAINDQLEAWIRARPESWLWMHRRWPKSVYRRIT